MNAKPADPAIRKDIQADVRNRSVSDELSGKEMAVMWAELRAR
jgi:hypothetical protein